MISPSSGLESASESTAATSSQCNALKYFLKQLCHGTESRTMTKPVGLRMRSISISRSSTLHPSSQCGDDIPCMKEIVSIGGRLRMIHTCKGLRSFDRPGLIRLEPYKKW
ncbi:hypothetical protein HPP92_014391 [Vanilla planifolia]|uniref:Uncharacterized protein n=1 Tax=Vanilla planifolia TaxID=51239 RepID=A0A835QQV5_VANPL|nr:hypothetical protein HPP92_014391 [Vanilla planifolia]